MDLSAFGMFVRPTGKGRATRYSASGNETIGIVIKDGTRSVDTSIICALTIRECTVWRREYARQIKEGALEKVAAQDYLDLLEADKKAALKAQKDAAKASADAAKSNYSELPNSSPLKSKKDPK